MYMYVHSKIGNRSFGRGKNESNFEKISIFGNVYFFIIGYSNAPFFSSCASLFFFFSLSPPTKPSPLPATDPAIHTFECRVTSFIFIQILVAAALKHTAAACLPNVGLRGRTPYIFESVFFAVVVGFFFLFVSYA